MKFKLLFVAVLISASVVGQNVPSYIPTNGLVGWWGFNGNANDLSGNGNNGTVIGATLTTDNFGNSNSAYSFDGIDDKIEYGNNGLGVGSGNFTISFDFKSNDLNGVGHFLNTGGQTPTDFHVYYLNNSLYVGTYNVLSNQTSIPFVNYLNNSWHNVLITWDGSNMITYLNSNPVATITPPYSATDPTMTLGEVGNVFGDFSIDNLSIWNRALTPQEITSLYQAQQPQCLPSYVPTNGLVGWWPFCGNANDESGNGNNGTVNGATLTSDRNGIANAAYNFDGSNSFIEINSSQSLEIVNTYTINGWFNSNSFFFSNTSDRSIISKVQPSGWSGGYEVMVGGNSNAISHTGNIGGNNFIVGDTGYSINTWYMFTALYSGSQINLYVNGILVDSLSRVGLLQASSNPLYFGRRSGFVQGFFSGQIDDIGIWNRALTQQEITALYLAQNCNGGNTITPDGPTTFCAGNSVKMTSSAVGATYQWQRNGVNISGATTRRYKAVQGGSYTCVATCNGTLVTSNTIQLTWLENKPVTLSAAGSTAFCVGDSVTLNVTNPGANYSIQWYRTNISLPGQTGTSLVVTQPGTYKVVTRNNLNGCSRISSSGITTTSNCRTADREVSEGFNEDEELSSARVLDNENSQGVKIYPNPNQGRFRFEYRGHESGSATLQVINSMGQQLHEQQVVVVDGLLETDIQLNGQFTSGIYIVRMVLNGGIHDSRVVVE